MSNDSIGSPALQRFVGSVVLAVLGSGPGLVVGIAIGPQTVLASLGTGLVAALVVAGVRASFCRAIGRACLRVLAVFGFVSPPN